MFSLFILWFIYENIEFLLGYHFQSFAIIEFIFTNVNTTENFNPLEYFDSLDEVFNLMTNFVVVIQVCFNENLIFIFKLRQHVNCTKNGFQLMSLIMSNVWISKAIYQFVSFLKQYESLFKLAFKEDFEFSLLLCKFLLVFSLRVQPRYFVVF